MEQHGVMGKTVSPVRAEVRPGSTESGFRCFSASSPHLPVQQREPVCCGSSCRTVLTTRRTVCRCFPLPLPCVCSMDWLPWISPSSCLSCLFLLSCLITIILNGCQCVTVHEVRLLSDSGKTDYALAGEGVTFSCLFILDPREVIHSVIWHKDKEQVYTYYKGTMETPVAAGVLEGHVDLSNESPSTLIIKNTTIEMQGAYSCHVITAKGKSQNEAFLIVIVDACKESSWETTTDMVGCIEDITFYCRGMFPKPAPVCGIYNDATGSYVQSVPFDRVEKMEDGTYEISLFRRLHAKDWLKQAGQLSFRCFMIVMSTTWRKGIHHHLFGEAGCVAAPPIVNNGYYNMTTSEKTCWRSPREGSSLTYSCETGFDLLGPDSYVCRNGTWKPLPSATPSTRRIDSPLAASMTNTTSTNKVFTRRLVPKGHQITVCNKSSHLLRTIASPVMLMAIVTIISTPFR